MEAVPMELDRTVSWCISGEAHTEVKSSEYELPVTNEQRTAAHDADSKRPSTRGAAGKTVESSNEVVGSRPREKAVQLLCFEIAYQRAVSMFARGRDASIEHGGDAVINDPIVDTCLVVKSAVKAAFHNHGGDISRSPERPDLRLSKEEGQGYLVGSLVVGELLAKDPP